jgi:hypothetical protein
VHATETAGVLNRTGLLHEAVRDHVVGWVDVTGAAGVEVVGADDDERLVREAHRRVKAALGEAAARSQRTTGGGAS